MNFYPAALLPGRAWTSHKLLSGLLRLFVLRAKKLHLPNKDQSLRLQTAGKKYRFHCAISIFPKRTTGEKRNIQNVTQKGQMIPCIFLKSALMICLFWAFWFWSPVLLLHHKPGRSLGARNDATTCYSARFPFPVNPTNTNPRTLELSGKIQVPVQKSATHWHCTHKPGKVLRIN